MQQLVELALNAAGYATPTRPRLEVTRTRLSVARHIQNLRRAKKKIRFSREEKVRRICESLYYPLKFPTVRPEWLLNDQTGQALELDLYNERLGVAIEVQGAQHTRFVPHFHKTYEEYLKMKQRDALKAALCAKKGVHLFYVPDIRRVADEELEFFIMSLIKIK